MNIQPDNLTSLLNIVKILFTNEFFDIIVIYASKYAYTMMNDPDIPSQINAKHKPVFNQWRDTNKDEMWLFFASFYMGIIHKPNIHLYWNFKHILSTPIFSCLIRKDR